MKKAFLVLLSAFLLLSLMSCKSTAVNPDTSEVTSETTSEAEASSEIDSTESYENSQESSSSVIIQTDGDFEYTENEDGITVTKYIGDSKEVVIPETIDGKPVTVIGRYFLNDSSNRNEVISVSMPDTVRIMEYNAFASCYDLKTVQLPSGLQTIADDAFYGCSSLETIQLPSGLQTIGNHAFHGCNSLETIQFPSGLLTIGDDAFRDCYRLTDIILPESLTEIGSHAFASCKNLKEISIPENVVEVGNWAFHQCPLERISFAENGRLEEIAPGAFAETMVTEITFPSSLRKLWDQAFAACPSLNKVTLNDGLQFIDSWVFAKTAISELRIPASVEDIDFYVLSGHLNPVALYFEGDFPEDFFQRAALTPNNYTDMTFYLHEGARGFGIEGAELFTIKTW